MDRENFSSGTPWEPLIGYSRAVRVGTHVYVSGTAAIDSSGTLIGVGDAYQQTKYVIEKVKAALEQTGAKLQHVVRTRLYVSDINRWKDYARAHREYFENIRPANTIVEVRLVDPRMLVEIEVDAVITS